MLAPIVPVPAAPAAQLVLTPERLRKLGKAVATVLRYAPTGGRGQRLKISEIIQLLHHPATEPELWALFQDDATRHRPRFRLTQQTDAESGWIDNLVEATFR